MQEIIDLLNKKPDIKDNNKHLQGLREIMRETLRTNNVPDIELVPFLLKNNDDDLKRAFKMVAGLFLVTRLS